MFPGAHIVEVLKRKSRIFEGTGEDFIESFDPSKFDSLVLFSIEHKLTLHGIEAKRIKGTRGLIMVQTEEGFVVMINKDTPKLTWTITK